MVYGFPGLHGENVTSHVEAVYSSEIDLVTAPITMGLTAAERIYRTEHAMTSVAQVKIFFLSVSTKQFDGIDKIQDVIF